MFLTIPFLDHVLTDLQHRFLGNELVPYRGFYLILYLMFQKPENWKEEFIVFRNCYCEDLPNFTGLAEELDLWHNFWDEIKYKNNLPDSILSSQKKLMPWLSQIYIWLRRRTLGSDDLTVFKCFRVSFFLKRQAVEFSFSLTKNSPKVVSLPLTDKISV